MKQRAPCCLTSAYLLAAPAGCKPSSLSGATAALRGSRHKGRDALMVYKVHRNGAGAQRWRTRPIIYLSCRSTGPTLLCVGYTYHVSGLGFRLNASVLGMEEERGQGRGAPANTNAGYLISRGLLWMSRHRQQSRRSQGAASITAPSDLHINAAVAEDLFE